jgi:hypothetical protein
MEELKFLHTEGNAVPVWAAKIIAETIRLSPHEISRDTHQEMRKVRPFWPVGYKFRAEYVRNKGVEITSEEWTAEDWRRYNAGLYGSTVTTVIEV